MTEVGELEAMADRHLAAVNQHDPIAITALYTLDGRWVGPLGRKAISGRRALKQYLWLVFNSFPDLAVSRVRALACGDAIAIEWLARGTQAGAFVGVPSTHKRVQVAGITVLHVEDGMITVAHHYCDGSGLLRQIGVLPRALRL
jgi:steroid delta-isomerase-like uncharacterized protein